MPAKSKHPPRFLPTLTEVVQVGPVALDAAKPALGDAVFATPLSPPMPEVTESNAPSPVELNVSKILFRLEVPLQARLKLAVGEIIQGHVDALMPLIAQEIEAVVRETVREGVTAELVRSRKAAG